MSKKNEIGQGQFDQTIGQLDRILSILVECGKGNIALDQFNQQTLKHHAEDMIAAGECILSRLAKPEVKATTETRTSCESPNQSNQFKPEPIACRDSVNQQKVTSAVEKLKTDQINLSVQFNNSKGNHANSMFGNMVDVGNYPMAVVSVRPRCMLFGSRMATAEEMGFAPTSREAELSKAPVCNQLNTAVESDANKARSVNYWSDAYGNIYQFGPNKSEAYLKQNGLTPVPQQVMDSVMQTANGSKRPESINAGVAHTLAGQTFLTHFKGEGLELCVTRCKVPSSPNWTYHLHLSSDGHFMTFERISDLLEKLGFNTGMNHFFVVSMALKSVSSQNKNA